MGRFLEDRNPTEVPEDIDADQIEDEDEAAADSEDELYEWVMALRGRLNEAGPTVSDIDMESDPDYEEEMEDLGDEEEDELLGEEEEDEDEREVQAARFAQWKKDFLAARRRARQSGGPAQEGEGRRDAEDEDGTGAAPAK